LRGVRGGVFEFLPLIRPLKRIYQDRIPPLRRVRGGVFEFVPLINTPPPTPQGNAVELRINIGILIR